MNTVSNQKVVEVNKCKCDSKNLYSCINLKAMENAAQVLTAPAFKMWVYFASNQDGYTFALSSKEIEERWGMKRKQYSNAVNELIENNYLVPISEKTNKYTFMEM